MTGDDGSTEVCEDESDWRGGIVVVSEGGSEGEGWIESDDCCASLSLKLATQVENAAARNLSPRLTIKE